MSHVSRWVSVLSVVGMVTMGGIVEAKNIGLAWDAPDNAVEAGVTGYKLYRKAGTGAYAVSQTLGNVLTATEVIAPGTGSVTYCWKVTAFNSDGESDFSNEVCEAVAPVTHAPKNLRRVQ